MKSKICKKCDKETKHRIVGGYPTCAVCQDNNSKKHRQKYRLRYLAQKANTRKKEGSEKITETMLKEIYDNQGGKCALSGQYFNTEESFYSPSLDRINSNLPYIKSNLQLVLFIVNKMKRELVQSEFIELCICISDNLKPHLYGKDCA